MTHPTDALRLVPVAPTREQELAMQRALLKDYPKVFEGEAYVNGKLLDAIYAAALAAAPASPLPEGGGWQDIRTAPKGNEESTWEPGPDILLYGGYNVAVGYWCNADKEWVTDYRGKGNGDYVSATHWMPLPAAPTGDA